jgi:hypothetical protein
MRGLTVTVSERKRAGHTPDPHLAALMRATLAGGRKDPRAGDRLMRDRSGIPLSGAALMVAVGTLIWNLWNSSWIEAGRCRFLF